MSKPFERNGDLVQVRLSAAEREALSTIPLLVEGAGDAGGRFDYRAYGDDDEAESRYRDIVGTSLDDARRADRSRLAEEVDAPSIPVESAEAWMRVIGDARLALAAMLGIEEDGWEEDADPGQSTEMALLTYLGYLQDQLVEVLL